MGPEVMVIATTPRTVGGALGARKVQRQIGQRGNGSGLEEGTVMCSPKWTLCGFKGGLLGTRKRCGSVPSTSACVGDARGAGGAQLSTHLKRLCEHVGARHCGSRAGDVRVSTFKCLNLRG